VGGGMGKTKIGPEDNFMAKSDIFL